MMKQDEVTKKILYQPIDISFISMPTGPSMQRFGLGQQEIMSLASTPGTMVHWSSGHSFWEVNLGCQHGNMH